MIEDLKYIELYYGKKMMTLCEELFPQLLKIKGLLPNLIEKEFAHSNLLYDDIIKYNQKENFKAYIYGLLQDIDTEKKPQELLHEVGYTLYECKTRDELIQLKKLINPTKRPYLDLDKKYIFFLIQNNADKLEEKPYKQMNREDEYGRSILLITITKGKNNVLQIIGRHGGIPKRYDFTYYNNLDNIVPGLTKSFEKEYRLDIIQNGKGKLELPGYVKANDKKYYKYNYKSGNIFYGPNNIIIDNYEVIKEYQDKNRYILIDEYIIDLIEKKLIKYNNILDGFMDTLNKIETIDIIKTEKEKIIKITCFGKNNIEIKLDENNRIIEYKNEKIKRINDNFLQSNKTIKKIELPNVEKIGECFLTRNETLKELITPKLKEVKNGFLKCNTELEELILPNLEYFGYEFLFFNESLKRIESKIKEKIENREVFRNIIERQNEKSKQI